MNSKKHIALAVVFLVVVFYSGMKYGQTNRGSMARSAGGRFAQMGAAGFAGGDKKGDGGIFLGEVMAKDESGITVKLPTGGSKIVFVGKAVSITRSASSTIEDIAPGMQVSIKGTANSDGSMTASSIDIR